MCVCVHKGIPPLAYLAVSPGCLVVSPATCSQTVTSALAHAKKLGSKKASSLELSNYTVLCYAMPCHAMPCHAMPYYTTLN